MNTVTIKVFGNVIGLYARYCATGDYFDTVGFITDSCQTDVCQYYDVTKFDLTTVPIMSAKISQIVNFAFIPTISQTCQFDIFSSDPMLNWDKTKFILTAPTLNSKIGSQPVQLTFVSGQRQLTTNININFTFFCSDQNLSQVAIPLQTMILSTTALITFPSVSFALESSVSAGLCDIRYRLGGNVPVWAEINELTKTIILTPTAQSHVGTFLFDLVAEFKDFTQISNVTKVTVKVLPACIISSILDQKFEPLQPLTVSIRQPEVLSFELPEYKDQVSLDRGDSTGYNFCGPRVYTLISTAFAKQDRQNPKLITILNNQLTSIGVSTIEILISLQDYPTAKTLTVTFPLLVAKCIIRTLELQKGASPMSPIINVGNVPFSFSLKIPRYVPQPSCDSNMMDVQYDVAVKDSGGTFAQNDWFKYLRSDQLFQISIQPNMYDLSKKSFKLEVTCSLQNTTVTFGAKIVMPLIKLPNAELKQPSQDLTNQTQVAQLNQTLPQNSDESDKDLPPPQTDANTSLDEIWEGWKSLLKGFKKPTQNKAQKKQPVSPHARISEINTKGQIIITFDQDIFEILDNANSVKRRLYSDKDVLDVQLISQNNLNASMMEFSYTANFTDKRNILIQLNFSNPIFISSSGEPDQILIKFLGPFMSIDAGLPVIEKSLKKAIPPQVVPGLATDTIIASTEATLIGSGAMLATNGVVNILLQGSLNQVWGSINNMQVVIITPLMQVNFPGNALLMYNKFITIATFDFLPTDKIYNHFWTLDDSQPFNEKFDMLGYGCQYIINNLGTALIFIILQIISYPIYLLLKFISPKHKVFENWRKRMHSNLFWSGSILIIQEMYQDIIICGLINVFLFKSQWNFGAAVFSNILTGVLLLGAALLPLVLVCYLWPRYASWKEKWYLDRFAPIYDMVDYEENHYAPVYLFLFFVRRLLFSAGVIFLNGYVVFQIMLYVFPALAVLITYGLVRPFKDARENQFELYNTFSILQLSYILFCFTDFVDNPQDRYMMGYIMVVLTFQNIIVNLIYIGRQPVQELFKKIKKNIQDCKSGKRKRITFKRSKTKLVQFARRQSLLVTSTLFGDGELPIISEDPSSEEEEPEIKVINTSLIQVDQQEIQHVKKEKPQFNYYKKCNIIKEHREKILHSLRGFPSIQTQASSGRRTPEMMSQKTLERLRRKAMLVSQGSDRMFRDGFSSDFVAKESDILTDDQVAQKWQDARQEHKGKIIKEMQQEEVKHTEKKLLSMEEFQNRIERLKKQEMAYKWLQPSDRAEFLAENPDFIDHATFLGAKKGLSQMTQHKVKKDPEAEAWDNALTKLRQKRENSAQNARVNIQLTVENEKERQQRLVQLSFTQRWLQNDPQYMAKVKAEEKKNQRDMILNKAYEKAVKLQADKNNLRQILDLPTKNSLFTLANQRTLPKTQEIIQQDIETQDNPRTKRIQSEKKQEFPKNTEFIAAVARINQILKQ